MNTFKLSAFCVVILVALSCSAANVTYTFDGIGNGSLNGVSFTDASFTLTTSSSASLTSFSIFGVGSGTLSGTSVFVNNGAATSCPTFPTVSSAVGIGQGLDIFDVCNNAFLTYNLTQAIGPIPAVPFPVGNSGAAFTTSAGNLIFINFESGTFTASTVPEPSSLALLGSGITGALTLLRRKRIKL